MHSEIAMGAIAVAQFISPIGVIQMSADETHLVSVRIKAAGNAASVTGHPILAEALSQIRDWFAGQRQDFNLPLVPLNTAEGRALRDGIAAIPYGETRTYGTVAQERGSIARAVGQACKTNNYPLIIPCHRVTSAAGPEFYSAGEGARTKGWLLDFEQDHLPAARRTRLI
jgi:methylated-DNA-[protein]-cysteine S-methyltransferase